MDSDVKARITPLELGDPDYVITADIILDIPNEVHRKVATIQYQHFWNEEYQYVMIPEWDAVDEMIKQYWVQFDGIPGYDMEVRNRIYYRVNMTPALIVMRTPPRNRQDIQELLAEVGMNCYQPLEFLIRTPLRAGQDYLIFERGIDQILR